MLPTIVFGSTCCQFSIPVVSKAKSELRQNVDKSVAATNVEEELKEIDKATVKLQPLDLAPNDYVSDFLQKLNGKEDKQEDSKMVEVKESEPEPQISTINPV